MRTLILILCATLNISGAFANDVIDAAKATFETSEATAREQLREQLTATIFAKEAEVTAADAGCSEAKNEFVTSFLARSRANEALIALSALFVGPPEPAALAAYQKNLEDMRRDAEAQIDAAKAKAETFGTARVAAQEALSAAQAELERIKVQTTPGFVRPEFAGVEPVFSTNGESHLSSSPNARRVTIPLPEEFLACGLPCSIETMVVTP